MTIPLTLESIASLPERRLPGNNRIIRSAQSKTEKNLRGDAMTRIFGLIVGIAMCLQSASGALLLSYRFEAPGTPPNTVGTTAARYDGILTNSEINGSAFTNVNISSPSANGNGIISGSSPAGNVQPTSSGNTDRYWQTAGNINTTFQNLRYNEFIVTNPTSAKIITVESISLSAWRGNALTSGTGRVSIQYSVNGGMNWNRWVTTTNNTVSSYAADSAIAVANQAAKPAQSSLSLTTPVTLLAQQSIRIRFIYDRAGTTINQFRLDDIQLFGTAVTAVPEPLSIATFGLVGAGLALVRRRKQS